MTKENLTTNEGKLAQTLFAAYSEQKPLQMTDYSDVLSNDESAYRVQSYLTSLKQEPIGGYKVSLTSAETQALFAADAPLYGAQISSHFVESPHTFLRTELMDPLAEVELMITAKEDLSSADSPAELLEKTTVAPAIEVPDSRFSDWFPSLPKHLVMADAAVGGYVVYGKEQDSSTVFATPDDVAAVHCQLFHNDKRLKDGAATEVLDNPLNSLHWLVAKLEEQGLGLTSGQRVSSGTFLLPENLTVGNWRAEFDSGLSDVSLDVK
ncbi:2-keto-4-pentenoate hydratase [Ligilactobacillus acidipiscis]|uniref:2-keto-4-pentenoate hydratase n=1 Tax=Ligilactobacillus acidipiscis TaxID=89059 RepID=UPI0022E95453|nr:2-keto-4-pentenoate hydratase [Ligilactobacillus acidipiscis]